jgi:hypothetical protein
MHHIDEKEKLSEILLISPRRRAVDGVDRKYNFLSELEMRLGQNVRTGEREKSQAAAWRRIAGNGRCSAHLLRLHGNGLAGLGVCGGSIGVLAAPAV